MNAAPPEGCVFHGKPLQRLHMRASLNGVLHFFRKCVRI